MCQFELCGENQTPLLTAAPCFERGWVGWHLTQIIYPPPGGAVETQHRFVDRQLDLSGGENVGSSAAEPPDPGTRFGFLQNIGVFHPGFLPNLLHGLVHWVPNPTAE